jgi:hypothetical protein
MPKGSAPPPTSTAEAGASANASAGGSSSGAGGTGMVVSTHTFSSAHGTDLLCKLLECRERALCYVTVPATADLMSTTDSSNSAAFPASFGYAYSSASNGPDNASAFLNTPALRTAVGQACGGTHNSHGTVSSGSGSGGGFYKEEKVRV